MLEIRATFTILGDVFAFAIGVPILVSLLYFVKNLRRLRCTECSEGMSVRQVPAKRGFLESLFTSSDDDDQDYPAKPGETYLHCGRCGHKAPDNRDSSILYPTVFMIFAPLAFIVGMLVKFLWPHYW